MKRAGLLTGLLVAFCPRPVTPAAPGVEVPHEIEAAVSAGEIAAGDPLALFVTLRSGRDSGKFLPLQRSDWPTLRLEFDDSVDGAPRGDYFEFGTRPAHAGVKPIRPVELGTYETLEATVDLAASQFDVFRQTSQDRTSVFACPGTYSFRVRYRIDEEAAAAFGIEVFDISSKRLDVTVVDRAGRGSTECFARPETTGVPDEPMWLDLDGQRRQFPAVNEAAVVDRAEIRRIFEEISQRHAGGDGLSSKVRFAFRLTQQGNLVFFPSVTREARKHLLARAEEIRLLKEKMGLIRTQLRERGVSAYASGDWHTIVEVCGNE